MAELKAAEPDERYNFECPICEVPMLMCRNGDVAWITHDGISVHAWWELPQHPVYPQKSFREEAETVRAQDNFLRYMHEWSTWFPGGRALPGGWPLRPGERPA